jgi:hypothetical protein
MSNDTNTNTNTNKQPRRKPNTNKNGKRRNYNDRQVRNNQMNSQLSELFKKSQVNEYRQARNRNQIASRPLAALNQASVDGVDHINFFTNVSTELGSLLSTASRLSFTYGNILETVEEENFGHTSRPVKFESLKCLWAYFRTGCNNPFFFSAPDFKISQNYKAINAHPKQDSIFAVMVNAYYEKMLQYPELAKALVDCTLPFDYYTVRDGIKRRTSVSHLMINGLNEVRRALKSETKPRLESFLSPSDKAKALEIISNLRYDYIVNILISSEAFSANYEKGLEEATAEQKERMKLNLANNSRKQRTNAAKVEESKEVQQKMDEEAGEVVAGLAAMTEEVVSDQLTTAIAEALDIQDTIEAELTLVNVSLDNVIDVIELDEPQPDVSPEVSFAPEVMDKAAESTE